VTVKKITGTVAVKQTNGILTFLWTLRMSEMNLGLHQIGCSRCMDQQRRTICHQMNSPVLINLIKWWDILMQCIKTWIGFTQNRRRKVKFQGKIL